MVASHWRDRTLGELLEIKHGFAFKGEFFSDAGSFVLLTPGNFRENGGLKLKGDKEKFYLGDYPPEFLLKRGDLLVAMTDLTQQAPILGSPAFIPVDGCFLHNQRLGKFINVDQNELTYEFLFYLMNTNSVRGQILGSATGSTVRHTSPSRIYNVNVQLPPLPVQHRIAGILSAYDELIENNERRIEILEAMARAIYREWFTYLRFPGHELASQIPSPLGEIPQGWEVRRVADFAEFTKGFEPGSAAYKKQSDVGLVRFLRVGDLSKRNSGLFVDADLAKGRVLQPLDIAITLDGSVGEVKLGLSGAYSSGIRRVDIKDPQRLGWAFAYQLLLSDSIQAVIHAHAKGTTIKHAGTAVAALVYVSPTKDVIENYERIAAPLMRQVLVLQEQVENLRRTRDLLLPRLLSGELDVEASAA